MRLPAAASLAAALMLLASGSAAAQSITALVVEGDAVGGVGNVSTIANLAVNASGTWFVEADTDNADTEADSVLLRDGALFLQEGQVLGAPTGALLDSLDSVTIDSSGRGGFNHFLDGTTGLGDDSGVYRDGTLVIQEGMSSSAPELSPGTPYIGFFDVKIDDGGHLYTIASVDDVNIATTVDRVIARFELDGGGAVLSESVLWKEGDILPGQTEAIADFETDPQESDVNGLGQVLFGVDLAGDTLVDGAIYLDSTLIAQEGSPSPVTGRNWLSLASPEVGLNDLGQVACSGSLDGDAGSNLVILKDGAKLVQEGDSLPATGAFTFTTFGSGPVRSGNDGRPRAPRLEPALQPAGTPALGRGALERRSGLRLRRRPALRRHERRPLRHRQSGLDGTASWGPGLAAQAGFVAGDERHFQVWYRDPSHGPCGTGFNLSNGFTITFAP